MLDTDGVGVFLGTDVGKSVHHGHGLTPAGKKVFDKPMPNSEPKLRAVFDKLKAKFGTVLVIVDQPASIGALPLTVARDAGCQVAYLPGLAMRRIADLYPGEAKTDAKDAAVIADAARTMPHILRSLELTDEITAELTVLTGFDQDLAAEATRTSNRIRGLLTQFHPSLEQVLGPRLDHPVVTWLLERYGSPSALRKAGRRRLVELIRPKAPRMAQRLIDDVFGALDEQTVIVPGTGTLDIVIPSLAASLAAVHGRRRPAARMCSRSSTGPPSSPGSWPTTGSKCPRKRRSPRWWWPQAGRHAPVPARGPVAGPGRGRRGGRPVLAERVGITPANLAVLKNGRAEAVRFATLAALCEVLEMPAGRPAALGGRRRSGGRPARRRRASRGTTAP